MNFRVRNTVIHLVCSVTVAAIAWLLTSAVWFPAPLGALAGGTALFLILVSVDVVMGPALTAIVLNPNKPRSELHRDLSVIVVLQMAAFAYGLYSMAQARPVAVVFEVDLFRPVSAAEVDVDALKEAPESFQHLPWTGPMLIAVIKPTDPNEQLRSIDLGLAGIPLAAMPRYWRPYAQLSAAAWAKAQPVAALLATHPQARVQVEQAASDAGVRVDAIKTLPLLARAGEGAVLLAPPDARVIGMVD